MKLKNSFQIFGYTASLGSFLKNEEANCILYSKEGIKFDIHKEILYQTEFMRNILKSTNIICCGTIEFLCPCSEDELESMVNFLYNGTISELRLTDVAKILDNLTKMFGFSEKSFSVEDCSAINKPSTQDSEEEFKISDQGYIN